MKKIYLFLTFSLSLTLCDAQKHDYIWTFGYDGPYPKYGGTNLNFNKNPVDTDYVKRYIEFGLNSASVSDKEGNLKFSTNGCKIFNRKNILTLNGDGLNPGYVSNNYCKNGNLMAQSSMFLPHSTDSTLYYLFHLHPEYTKNDKLGLIADQICYTLLDTKGDNGNGEVLSKNNIIHKDTIAFGKMTAVRHGNGRDWWIIVPRMLKNQYIKLLFTGKEILGPFFQDIGPKNKDDNGTGQAVFSPDGSKYIHFDRYNDLSIFDFDRCTGELSNPKNFILPTARDTVYSGSSKYSLYSVGGVAVSPNNKFLYVTTQTHVFQYNLKADDIGKSIITVAVTDSFIYANNGSLTRFFLPHIAPDNKIYINCTNTVPYLHVINNPDEAGLACNLTQHSFKLPTLNAYSIPNFPNFRLGALKGSACDTLNKIATKEIETGMKFKVFPNPAMDMLYIQYPDNQINTNLKINISDLSGSVLLKSTLNSTDSKIDIGVLKNGFYIINLIEDNKLVATERFVKIN